MAGRTPASAVAAFLDPIKRAFSCVSRSNHLLIDGHAPDVLHAVTLPGEDVALGGNLSLSFVQAVEIVQAEGDRGPWKVRTRGYDYQLRDERGEILAYHWHPLSTPHQDEPHLHVHAERLGGHKTHLPTGRVAVEDVLLLAIGQLEARPVRSDWREVLEESRDAFRRWRTWS